MFDFFKKLKRNQQQLAIEILTEEKQNKSKKVDFEVKRQEYKRQQELKAELWRKQHGIQMSEEDLRKKYGFKNKSENEMILPKENIEQEQDKNIKKEEDRKVIEMDRELRLQKLINGGVLESNIGKVKYYDEDSHLWRSSVLTLANYILTFTFDNGGSTEVTITDDYLYSVKIEQDQYFDRCSIQDENGSLVIDFLYDSKSENIQPELVIEHFELLNGAKPIRDKVNRIKNEEFVQHSKEMVEKLLQNEDVTIFLDGYLAKTEQDYFLDPYSFVAFEKLLYFNNRECKGLLGCDPEQNEWPQSVELESLEAYYQDSFSLFVRVLTSKNFFGPVQEGDILTWLLLRKRAVTFFSNCFDAEYGNLFAKLNENSSAYDYVSTYMRIETINIESVISASLLTYFFMKKTNVSDEDYLDSYQVIKNEILQAISDKHLKNFELSLFEIHDPHKDKTTITDVDLMDGHDFEHFIAKLFRKMGYSSEVTKGSGDQGIDVIATKDGRKYGIQTKCYSSAVSNKAIQEVVAGIKHYKLDKGLVITNNYFTESAQELASSNGVILWNRTVLNEKIKEYL